VSRDGSIPLYVSEEPSSVSSQWKSLVQMTRRKIGEIAKRIAQKSKYTLLEEKTGSNWVSKTKSEEIYLKKSELRRMASMAKHVSPRVTFKKRGTVIGKLTIERLQEAEHLLRRVRDPEKIAPSSDRLHLGRPVRMLSTRRKEMVEAILKSSIPTVDHAKKRGKEIKPPSGVSEMSKKLAEKVAQVKSVEPDLLSSGTPSMSLGLSVPPVPSFSSESLMNAVSKAMLEEEQEKQYPDIETIIDSILEDSEELRVFSMDSNPFFSDLPLGSEERRTFSQILAESFAYNTHFETISLCGCSISDEFILSLCDYIKKGHLSQVKVLKLRNNMIGSQGLSALGSLLQLGFQSSDLSDDLLQCPFEELYLSGQMVPMTSDAQVDLLSGAKSNTQILKFQASFVSDEAHSLVADFLSRNRRLKEQSEKTKGCSHAFTPLEQKIQSLLTNDENEEDTDMFEVDGDLSFTILKPREILSIAKAMRLNYTLKVLRICNVQLTDEFACALASSLVDNNSLDLLDLSRNSFSSQGIIALVWSLETNTSLRHFNVLGQDPDPTFSSEEQNDMIRLLDLNQRLLSIYIPIAAESFVQDLEKIISRNCLSQLSSWSLE
jgi:hypothetical protein